jgi:hypothetical protein
LRVDDVDGFHERALAAGAEILQAPHDEPLGNARTRASIPRRASIHAGAIHEVDLTIPLRSPPDDPIGGRPRASVGGCRGARTLRVSSRTVRPARGATSETAAHPGRAS